MSQKNFSKLALLSLSLLASPVVDSVSAQSLDGQMIAHGQMDVTTLAMGEEGGGSFGRPMPRQRQWTGGGNRQSDVTTLAMGEEGGGSFSRPMPRQRQWNRNNQVTSMVVGEEGGGSFVRPRPIPHGY